MYSEVSAQPWTAAAYEIFSAVFAPLCWLHCRAVLYVYCIKAQTIELRLSPHKINLASPRRYGSLSRLNRMMRVTIALLALASFLGFSVAQGVFPRWRDDIPGCAGNLKCCKAPSLDSDCYAVVDCRQVDARYVSSSSCTHSDAPDTGDDD